jgi:hypothetical protein
MATIPVPVQSLNTSVTLIRIISTGRAPQPCELGSATGFFFKENERRFLVTNRHVVIDEENHHYPDKLAIRVHTSERNITLNRDIELPLYNEDNEMLWLQHQNTRIDVVALEIGRLLNSSDVVKYWVPEEIPRSYELIEVGSHAMVIGYPLGLYDKERNLPITSSATVATVYRGSFNGLPLFLVHTSLREGTSGSPVAMVRSTNAVTVAPGGIVSSFPASLLGIHSGPWFNSPSFTEVGFHAVWYPELISEIISQNAERL